MLSLVKNNPSIEKDIQFLKETAESLVDDKVEDKEKEERKPKAIEKQTKKRRYTYS